MGAEFGSRGVVNEILLAAEQLAERQLWRDVFEGLQADHPYLANTRIDFAGTMDEVKARFAGEDDQPVDEPHFMVVDSRLPGGSGLLFTRELRERGFRRARILVLNTPFLDTEDEEKKRALDAGANGYLRKPYTVEEVAAQIIAAFAPREEQ